MRNSLSRSRSISRTLSRANDRRFEHSLPFEIQSRTGGLKFHGGRGNLGEDTGGTSAFTASYYVNDLARSITQDGVTQTLDLDPMQRMSVKTTASSGPTTTETYAYTDDSDSPAFTQKGAAWNRTVMGIGGAEAVQDSATGVKLLIQNLRGDVVAQSTTAGTLSNFSRVDEFGVPKSALPAGTKYAFHGSKQREALTAGGMVAMGVRLYQPQMGRFLQVDPVLGGTANAYEYPSDPINDSDLRGQMSFKKFWGRTKNNLRRAAKKFDPKLGNLGKYFSRKGLQDLKANALKIFNRGFAVPCGVFTFVKRNNEYLGKVEIKGSPAAGVYMVDMREVGQQLIKNGLNAAGECNPLGFLFPGIKP